MNPLEVSKACLQAYVDYVDRDTIESLISDDYHFTSPIDNALDRETYFESCWPSSADTQAFEFIYQAEHGEQAFVVYEARTSSKTFRNSEVHAVRDRKLVSTEVFFGWELPHKAPDGGFIENSSEGHA